MTRMRIMCGAILCLLTVAVFSTMVQAESEPTDDDALLLHLSTQRIDVDYDREDLERVFEDLRDRGDLNLFIYWSDLERWDVKRDRRVSLRLKGVAIGRVLELLVGDFDGHDNELGVSVHDGVVMVGTVERAARYTELRPYDVTDLLESGYAIRRFFNTPVLGLATSGREGIGGETRSSGRAGGGGGGGYGGGGGGGSMFGNAGVPRGAQLELMQRLVNFLQSSASPDSWQVTGGDVGSMTSMGNVLYITHTVEVHRHIQELLDLLRASKAIPLTTDAVFLRLSEKQSAQWKSAFPEFPRIPAEAMDEILAHPDLPGLMYRGTMSGRNGDRVWFSALQQRDVITGYLPVIGAAGLGFAPQRGVATDGLELIVLPLLDPDRATISVDVQMAWIPPSECTPREVRLASGEGMASVDQVKQSMRTVSATATVVPGDGLAFSVPRSFDSDSENDDVEWLIVRVRTQK